MCQKSDSSSYIQNAEKESICSHFETADSMKASRWIVPLFVDTGKLPVDDVISFDLEAYWRPGPYLLGFEYIGSNLKSPDLGDPFFGGYAVTGAWAVTHFPLPGRSIRVAGAHSKSRSGTRGWTGMVRKG